MRLDTIDRRLAQLPVRLVLELLAQMCFWADDSIGDRRKQMQFLQQLLPAPYSTRAVSMLTSDPHLAPPSSQTILNLALRALTTCPDSAVTAEVPQRVAQELGLLLLALVDHNVAGLSGPDALVVEIARLGHYYGLNDRSAWYEIALRMFFEELPALTTDTDYVDMDEVIRAAYGMGLDVFWSLTAGYGAIAQYQHEGYWLPGPMEGMADPQAVIRWLEAWTTELDEARVSAQRDLAVGSWWSFTAFYERPIIRLASHGGVALRPAFLSLKATPAGMFWAIRNPYVLAGGDHERLARFFGRLVEATGRRLVSEYAPDAPQMVDENAIRARWGAGKTCDMVLLGRNWIAVDFVHRQLTLRTAATGGIADLVRDVNLAAVEKLIQIDETLARGLATEPQLPESVFPLVVVGAPFPTNPLVLDYVSAQLLTNTCAVIGNSPLCRPPAVMDLAEFSVLLQASAHLGTPVADLLEGWHRSGLARDNFRSWLTTDGPGHGIPGGGAISTRWQGFVQSRLFSQSGDTP